MSGIKTAVIREKIVRTSAALVAGRLHSALDNLSIAESITPAWLIPIQKTKFVIKNPHITGLFNPVTPRPLLIINATATVAARTTRPKVPTIAQ